MFWASIVHTQEALHEQFLWMQHAVIDVDCEQSTSITAPTKTVFV
jgi:hypothetical protein